MKFPHKASQATVPFTSLPKDLLDCPIEHWKVIAQGRLLFSDHITLVEARTVHKCAHALSANTRSHNHKVMSLQDNQPCAGAYNKGRSTAPALNFILRKKSACCLLASLQFILPWIETSKMPADWVSRCFSSP